MFKKKSPPTLDIVPPSGLFVKTPNGDTFYVKGGSRYSISDIHLESWGTTPIPVTATALLTVPLAGKIGFRDGSLCKDFGNGKMYLISDSRKRPIASPAIYEALGGDRACFVVSSTYLQIHAEGDPLD
jgi:hypothetical protein